MFLPTYKPVLINDEEWKLIWEKAYLQLESDPMFTLQYSETKTPKALKFSFLRTIPDNPEYPSRTMRDEILDTLEHEEIEFDPTRHYIISVFVESFNKSGIAIFEMWDKS